MPNNLKLGAFDLDITLRDAAVDELLRPTRRMLANASIGMEPTDAYYSTRELREAVEIVHAGKADAKIRLTNILATGCDDYQRCLYFSLAGRGVVQMMEDLEWLEDLLGARARLSEQRFREKEPTIPCNRPYVSAEPDGPLIARGDFSEGPSWYLDPQLGDA